MQWPVIDFEPLVGYLEAYGRVLDAGYGSDIEWAQGLADVRPSPTYVLQETAWVILNSGFRYAVARKLWPSLSSIFNGWDPELVVDECVPAGLRVLNHEGKIRAMHEVARIVREQGIEQIVADAREPPRLRRLPWIGDITCWHLAKVLGADVVKPDVHLQRAAKAAGYASPLALCEAIRSRAGDRLTVIDSVLWRYGERQRALGWPEWDALFGATMNDA